MKTFTSGSAVAAAQGVKRLVEIVRTFTYVGNPSPPAVLIVAPPVVEQLVPTSEHPLLSPRTDESRQLATLYATVAAQTGAAFFDAATVATAIGGGDGVHLDAANTRAIGEALAPAVAKILGIKEARAA
jgi:lysophospholipase L1-like esterase